MRLPASIALALLLCFQGQAATIYFDVADFQLSQSSFRALRMTPTTTPSLGGTNQVIINTPRRQVLNQYGRATFTNVVAGTYRVLFEGNPGVQDSTTWHITVTNTSDTINGALISSVATNNPTLASAYSMDAADQRFVRSLYTNGVLVAHSPYINLLQGTNIFLSVTNIGGTNYVYIASTAVGGGSGAGDVTYAQLAGSNYVNRTELNGSNYVTFAILSGSNFTTFANIAASNFTTQAGIAASNFVTYPILAGSNYTTQAGIAASNFVTFSILNGSNYVNRSELQGSNYTTQAGIAASNFVSRTELNGSNYTTRAQIAGSNFVSTGISDQYDAVAEKALPASADRLLIEDSEDTNAKKYAPIANFESVLESFLDLDQLQGTVGTSQIANNAVTGAKIAMGSDAQGDVLYYNGTDYARLGAGTSGQFLQTLGTGANPQWATPSGSGSGFPLSETVSAGGFGMTNIGRLNMNAGAITATPTNMTGSNPDFLMLGHSVGTITPTNTTMINLVTPTGTDWIWPPKTISVTTTGATEVLIHSITFSNAVADTPLLQLPGTTNRFGVYYDGITNRVFSWQESNYVTFPTLASSNYVSRSELNGSNYVARAELAGSNFVDVASAQTITGAKGIGTLHVGTNLYAADLRVTNYFRFVQGGTNFGDFRNQSTLSQVGAATFDGGVSVSAGALDMAAGTALNIGGQINLTDVLTPAQITADQDNYNPSGFDDVGRVRLATDAARSITGMVPGSFDDRVLVVDNIGAFAITLVNQSASSSAANRFAIGGNITLGTNQSCVLIYDTTGTRWRLVGHGRTDLVARSELSGSNYVTFAILQGSNYVARAELAGSNFVDVASNQTITGVKGLGTLNVSTQLNATTLLITNGISFALFTNNVVDNSTNFVVNMTVAEQYIAATNNLNFVYATNHTDGRAWYATTTIENWGAVNRTLRFPSTWNWHGTTNNPPATLYSNSVHTLALKSFGAGHTNIIAAWGD